MFTATIKNLAGDILCTIMDDSARRLYESAIFFLRNKAKDEPSAHFVFCDMPELGISAAAISGAFGVYWTVDRS